MDVTSFEELLQLVAPIITRQDTNMKSTIPPGQRLALTHSLSSEFCCNLYQSFVSHVTIFVIFDLTSYRDGKVSNRLISRLVLSKLQSNSSAAMLIFPRNTVTPNDWLKLFNKRQLVERNRAMLYFRSTTFNNFQHVERQISTVNIT